MPLISDISSLQCAPLTAVVPLRYNRVDRLVRECLISAAIECFDSYLLLMAWTVNQRTSQHESISITVCVCDFVTLSD